jgi:hypothetical protein
MFPRVWIWTTYAFMGVYAVVFVLGVVLFITCRGKQPIAGRLPWISLLGSAAITLWALSVLFQIIYSGTARSCACSCINLPPLSSRTNRRKHTRTRVYARGPCDQSFDLLAVLLWMSSHRYFRVLAQRVLFPNLSGCGRWCVAHLSACFDLIPELTFFCFSV